MTFSIWFFLILGIGCLIYFGIIVAYTGMATSFGGFWIVSGIGCIVLSGLFGWMYKLEIIIPQYMIISGILLFGIGSFLFLHLEYRMIDSGKQIPDGNVDYMIILGARVNGSRITNSLRHRLDVGAKYLMDNTNTLVIVSGGKGPGEDITEASAMKEYLLRQGIEEKRILLEERSTSTNENIIFSKEIMQENNPRVVIVTNEFHIYRSLKIAKNKGLKKAQGLGAPCDKVLMISYYVREAFAIIKDTLVGNMY